MHRFLFLVLFLFVCLMPLSKGEEVPVRLHVVAENNETQAQVLKLKVKDAVLKKALEITKDAQSASEAYTALFTSIGEIRLCARETALKNGFTGEINAVVTREQFPARLYGDMIVKEGEYPTLLVTIGKAEGRNWWCVIYPDLCLYGEKADLGGIRFYSKFGYWFNKLMDRWTR